MSLMFNIKKWFLARKYNTEEKRKLPIYKLSFLELERKYDNLSEYDYKFESLVILNADKPKNELEEMLLKLQLEYKKITEVEYYKQINDLYNKPWVALKTKYDEKIDSDNMELEVEYNKTFIENMKKKGLPGSSDEEIVEQWLKLFLMANLEDDDLALLYENEMNKEPTHIKIGDNKVLKI